MLTSWSSMPKASPRSFVESARRFASQFASRLALATVVAATVIGVSVATPETALAVGTVKAEKTTLDEAEGTWKLKIVMDYGGQPEINFVPMLFVFTPTMLYERACTDASHDKPIVNKIPLQNQQSINEQLDVGFSDGTGKTFKETHFDFKIRRDRGFEAGEYTLEIKRASDNKTMGSKLKLVLNGNNKVVDRRAMNFVGEKKKDDPCNPAPDAPAQGSGSGGDTKPPPKKDTPPPANQDVHADGEIPLPPETSDAPPPVPPKQGGCGCELASRDGSDLGALSLVPVVGLGIFVARRGRRATRSSR